MYRYNPNASYHPNHGTYRQQMSSKDFTQQVIVVDQQGRSFQIEFSNAFVEYVIKEAPEKHINKWQHQPFYFWQTQLDFPTWCASLGCGISVSHLNSSLPMLRSVYRFHIKVLKELCFALPFESGFEKYNNRYDQTCYNKLSAEFHLSTDQCIWRNQYFL